MALNLKKVFIRHIHESSSYMAQGAFVFEVLFRQKSEWATAVIVWLMLLHCDSWLQRRSRTSAACCWVYGPLEGVKKHTANGQKQKKICCNIQRNFRIVHSNIYKRDRRAAVITWQHSDQSLQAEQKRYRPHCCQLCILNPASSDEQKKKKTKRNAT